jgi:hypothetical protein
VLDIQPGRARTMRERPGSKRSNKAPSTNRRVGGCSDKDRIIDRSRQIRRTILLLESRGGKVDGGGDHDKHLGPCSGQSEQEQAGKRDDGAVTQDTDSHRVMMEQTAMAIGHTGGAEAARASGIGWDSTQDGVGR